MHPVHVLEKETVYMKNNMEIKITEIKIIVGRRVSYMNRIVGGLNGVHDKQYL